MLISTIAIVFVFGLLVLVHEFGHFITAKKTGMRVDEFAIGFGPKIWSRQKAKQFIQCVAFRSAVSTELPAWKRTWTKTRATEPTGRVPYGQE